MNRRNTFYALAAILVALWIIMAPVMAANPAFNKAVADYKAGKYGQAASAFESLKTSYPSGGLSRYYLGLSRQALGQYAKAKEEYEWVATNGDAELKGMAQQGLQRLGASSTGSSRAMGKVRKIYDFNATWCGPCKKFAPIFETAKSKFAGVTFESVDVDRNPKLADQYKVTMLPHLVFLDARGNVLYSGDAFRSQESFEEAIKKYQ
jgi:thiol-disulfide isomerase/thioredoxin